MSFETIRGTYDIPPAEQPVWDLIRKAIRVTAETFCYRRVDTPIIESVGLFQRGIGEATDVVNKQMWHAISGKYDSAQAELLGAINENQEAIGKNLGDDSSEIPNTAIERMEIALKRYQRLSSRH